MTNIYIILTKLALVMDVIQRSRYKVTIKGSHYTFRKPGYSRITIPYHGKEVKTVYIRNIREILKSHGY